MSDLSLSDVETSENQVEVVFGPNGKVLWTFHFDRDGDYLLWSHTDDKEGSKVAIRPPKRVFDTLRQDGFEV